MTNADDTSASSRIADLVRSRGYWHVTLRPESYDEVLVPYTDLERLVRSARVSVRGWDLPHVEDPNPVHRGDTWIGGDVEWDYHLEVWRLYQSGQFVHLNALRDDWRDRSGFNPAPPEWRSGKILGVGDALYTLAEYYEFASRLALSLPGDTPLVIRLRLCNIRGRELVVDDRSRASFFSPRVTQAEKFDTGERHFTPEQLVSGAREFAVSTAADLFVRFGWEASTDLLRDHLEQLWKSP